MESERSDEMNKDSQQRIKIKKTIDDISIFSAKIVSWLCLAILILLCREVVGRYFFGSPLPLAEEINSYLFCILSTLGGAYCVATDSHIRVDVLWRRYRPKTKRVVEILTDCLVLLFVCVLAWIGIQEFLDAVTHDKRSMSIYALPLWPTILSVTVGSVLVGIQSFLRLCENVIAVSR